jgi:hypothetical protein
MLRSRVGRNQGSQGANYQWNFYQRGERMKTVSVEIKIPDGHEVEEVSMVWPGYEFSPGDAVGQMVVKTKPAKPFLINGVPSDWPEWLTCDWVAKDEDGEVYFHNSEPQIDHLAIPITECEKDNLIL